MSPLIDKHHVCICNYAEENIKTLVVKKNILTCTSYLVNKELQNCWQKRTNRMNSAIHISVNVS